MKFVILAFMAFAGTEASRLRQAEPNWTGFDPDRAERANIQGLDDGPIAAYKGIHQAKVDARWKYDMGDVHRCEFYAPCRE